MVSTDILKNAKAVWDFLHTGDQIQKADCIFTMGSNDLRVAERAAELYHQGLADLLIFSGGLGRFTLTNWSEPEAEKFAKIAMEKGVPQEKIIKETKSTNSGENVIFTRKLVEERGLDLNTFILVQKPYMEKRAYATFIRHWPNKKAAVTSPQISFEDYPNEITNQEALINTMVGDFQRLIIYPKLGFQAALPITDEAIKAYEFLVDHGFTKQLVKS
ncbi:MAG TPA: YdcF family protein [Salinimicrobium sp.]|nr:YdcF family protein [Salinimicrobium sp.]